VAAQGLTLEPLFQALNRSTSPAYFGRSASSGSSIGYISGHLDAAR